MKPTFKILAGGKDISAEVSARLVSLDWGDGVDEHSDGAQLVLADAEGTLELPKQGVMIEIWAGWNGALQKVGVYAVDEVEVEGPPDQIILSMSATPFQSATGVGQSSYTGRKNRSWDGKTLGDILKTIAKEAGLQAVIDQTLSAIEVPYIAQVNESDSNLLLRLARRYGAILRPMEGRLVMVDQNGGKSAGGHPLVTIVQRSEVTGWHFRRGGKMKGTKQVKKHSHNYATGEVDVEEVDVAEPEEDTNDE